MNVHVCWVNMRVTDDPDIYGLSLARALQLALLGMPPERMKSGTSGKLTGERFAEVLTHINDHLDQSTALKDLARISNMSPAQFSRSFQDATGMSLQRWQMDARIRSAQRLMVDDPTESLAAIAALVGFSDSSHSPEHFWRLWVQHRALAPPTHLTLEALAAAISPAWSAAKRVARCHLRR